MDKFDVVIIGSGPGGYVAAIRAGQLGLTTAIIEKDKNLGGTCLLRGCIPTKSLLHTADLLDEFKSAKEHGIVAGPVSLDFVQAQKRKGKVVLKLSKGVEFLMRKNKVQVFKGSAHIEGPGRISVTAADGSSQVIQTKNTIIATGSVPRSFATLPIEDEQISAELAKSFKKQGIKAFTSANFKSAVIENGTVRVTAQIGDEDREFVGEKFL